MLELAREECVRRLASHSFGRLAVTIGEGAPVIRPVNFVFDEPSRSVVFRTALGSKFHVLLRSADAAFEIDGIDQGSRTGWSVIMRGVTDEVTNPSELRRLDSLGLEPWAPGHKHAGCTSVRGQSRAGGSCWPPTGCPATGPNRIRVARVQG